MGKAVYSFERHERVVPVAELDWLPSVEPETCHVVLKHRHHHNVKHYTGEDINGETHTISVLEDYEVDEPYCSNCGRRVEDISGIYCAYCCRKFIDEGDK